MDVSVYFLSKNLAVELLNIFHCYTNNYIVLICTHFTRLYVLKQTFLWLAEKGQF